MNNNSFLIASFISVVYALSKYIECKFILKEELDFKVFIRDIILVYTSSLLGIFLVNQVNNKFEQPKDATTAFINKPDF